MGTLWFSGMLPAGRTETASTVGVAQSFGAQNTSTGSATLSASPSAATTVGDLLVVVIRDRNATALAPVSTVTDTAGNHWVRAASVTQGSQADGEIWEAASAASLTTSQSVKVTVGGTNASTSAIAFTVLDVTGASTTPLDVTATKSGNTQPASTGTTAPTAQAGEIAVGDIGWNSGSVTVSGQTANYTALPTQQSTVSGSAAGEQAAWHLLSATSAQSYSATLSSSTAAWTGAIATFKAGASAPPTITSFSPTSGTVGTPVVINGSGFTGATAVVFNSTTQSAFTVNSDIKISTTVPNGATTGPIKVTAPGGAVTSSTKFTVTTTTTPPHVMLIVEENHGYGGIIGNSNAPHINSLATTYASAAQWFGVQHNSPNDYMELLSGSNQGWPVTAQSVSATTLVDELHATSTPIPWKAYMENMPSTPTCNTATDPTSLYEVIHNPFRYFTRYTTNSGGWCSSANQSTEGVLPYPGSSGLLTALGATNAPDFVWITPNDCHSMHGDTNTASPCKSSTTSQLITAGDTWLNSNIGPVISSPWFSQNGIIIITWDESITSDTSGCCGGVATGGHIPTIVVTSNNKGLGNFTGTGDHYGNLAAIEKAFGVGLLGGSANSVNGDLSGAFGKPTTPGAISGTVTDSVTKAAVAAATVSFSGGSTTANSSGVYTLSNVAPGTYTVTASDTGYATQSASSVTVTSGATTTQTFALVPQPGTISGTATDSVTHAAILGATVSYTGPGGSSGNTTTAANGTYTLAMLPEGSYAVTAAATNHSSQTTAVNVAPGATTTQSFALVAQRDPFVQPFTSTSIWNMPIGSGALYVTSQIQQPTIKTLTADQAVTIQAPSAPATTVQQNGGQHTNTCTVTGGTLATDPIPADLLVLAANSNNLFAVIKADGQSIDEGGAFARCVAGGPATAGSLKTYGTLYGDGVTGGSGGSNLSTLGGTLRPGEIAPGKQGAPHALRVNIDGTHDLWPGTVSTCYRWPATKCDTYGPTGYGGSNPELTMGALLAIPASVDLTTLGLSPAGLELAWTMQNYGAYVVNDSARSVFTIATETGDASTVNQFQADWGFPFETADASGSSPWGHDVQTIISHLSVIKNNSASSIGGGGTPLQPLAPPLKGTSAGVRAGGPTPG